MKTNQLTGNELDLAVAMCAGVDAYATPANGVMIDDGLQTYNLKLHTDLARAVRKIFI